MVFIPCVPAIFFLFLCALAVKMESDESNLIIQADDVIVGNGSNTMQLLTKISALEQIVIQQQEAISNLTSILNRSPHYYCLPHFDMPMITNMGGIQYDVYSENECISICRNTTGCVAYVI